MGINGFEGVGPEWLLPKRNPCYVLEESRIWREREGNRPTGACPLYYLSLFLNFLSFFLCFLSYLFFFSFTLFSFFYSVNTLFFDPFLRTRQGSYYSACRGQFLPLCLLTTFVWSRRTCRPPKVCDTHPCQIKAGLFHSSVHRNTLSCHGINAFSLFPSRHAPNGSPLNLSS